MNGILTQDNINSILGTILEESKGREDEIEETHGYEMSGEWNGMRDLFFAEFRSCNKKIKSIINEPQWQEDKKLLMETIKNMMKLCNIARSHGVFSLEGAVRDMADFRNKEYLQKMVMLVADGTDPNLIEDICLGRYYAECMEGVEALQYLIMLIGCLSLQVGENPRVMEERITSFVPRVVADEYHKQYIRVK